MIFHIAICSPDGALRSRLEHQCMEFFARREDACIVEQLQSPEALLQQDAAGLRYELKIFLLIKNFQQTTLINGFLSSTH